PNVITELLEQPRRHRDALAPSALTPANAGRQVVGAAEDDQGERPSAVAAFTIPSRLAAMFTGPNLTLPSGVIGLARSISSVSSRGRTSSVSPAISSRLSMRLISSPAIILTS